MILATTHDPNVVRTIFGTLNGLKQTIEPVSHGRPGRTLRDDVDLTNKSHGPHQPVIDALDHQWCSSGG
jgi:hypothetical protein